MSVLNRRLQVLLDEDRFVRLEREAVRRGSSVATLVREAIDAALPHDHLGRDEAGRLLLDADPVPVGDWPDLKSEIEQLYDRATE